MGLINEYRAAVVAMYPALVLRDPYCDADDEDHGQARREALDAVVAANRYQAFVHLAQTVVPVAIRIQLWDQAPPTEPGDQWDGHDHVALHCPTGRLLVENTTAGAIPLHPGPVNDLALPGGRGEFAINISFTQRDATERAVMAAFINHRYPSPAHDQG